MKGQNDKYARSFDRVTKSETQNELSNYVIGHTKEGCTLTKGTGRVAGNAFIIFIFEY